MHALAHPGPLGLLGADAGRAGDPPGAGLFKEAGGTALADLTLPGIGRDPAWLLRISELSRLPIVMGGGWYRTAYYPPEALIEKRSVDSLAEELVHDATVGVGETGIRIGILGEIGTDKPWVTPAEERVFRAVARCSRRTGLAISTHAVLSDVGAAQLTILEEEGVDPGRVVIGHADSYPVLDHYLSLINRGASVEFDFLGMSFTPMEKHGEAKVIDLLLELLHRGHADRVLLSHDVCHNSQLRHFEGNGYTYLSDDVPAAAPRAGRVRGGDRAADGGEPAPDPHDRVGAGRHALRPPNRTAPVTREG